MRILVIGDPHFKVNNIPEVKALTREIYSYLDTAEAVDYIVCLGDILDRHEQIHVTPLTEANDFLKRLSHYAPTYLLIGNHDRPNNSNYLTNVHPFTAFGSDRITIVDHVVGIADKGLLFVPYVPPGRWYDALNTAPFPYLDAKIIFAHQEFRGCKMGTVISEVGDVWPEDYPYIISGHIHEYQQLQSNILYIGTPFQQNFGESPDKAIALITVGDTISCERIFLNIPKRKLINISYSELSNLNLEELLQESEPRLVRVSISISAAEAKTINNHPVIKQLQKKGVKVHYKPILETKQAIEFNSGSGFMDQLREKLTESEQQLMEKLGYYR